MGGYGSGWQGEQKAAVEESLILSLPSIMKMKTVVPGQCRRGTWGWKYKEDAEPYATIGYQSNLRDLEDASLMLDFKVNGQGIKQTIKLTITKPNYGGLRWWFVCPNLGIRASKLYLPPGQQNFASRRAHDLTYQSCRESGQYRSLYKLLGAETGIDQKYVERFMKNEF